MFFDNRQFKTGYVLYSHFRSIDSLHSCLLFNYAQYGVVVVDDFVVVVVDLCRRTCATQILSNVSRLKIKSLLSLLV